MSRGSRGSLGVQLMVIAIDIVWPVKEHRARRLPTPKAPKPPPPPRANFGVIILGTLGTLVGLYLLALFTGGTR